MPGPDILTVQSYAEDLSRMGVDNVTLAYDKDAKVDVCFLGFKEVQVKGVGHGPAAAMLDAYDKIKPEVKSTYGVDLPELIR